MTVAIQRLRDGVLVEKNECYPAICSSITSDSGERNFLIDIVYVSKASVRVNLRIEFSGNSLNQLENDLNHVLYGDALNVRDIQSKIACDFIDWGSKFKAIPSCIVTIDSREKAAFARAYIESQLTHCLIRKDVADPLLLCVSLIEKGLG